MCQAGTVTRITVNPSLSFANRRTIHKQEWG
jgi:hypothetical protein